MKKIKYNLFAILFVSILAVACSDDEKLTDQAVFSYVADGFQVTFTNFTFGAKEFEWDFNDGSETSSRKNPVHIFKEKGVYMVTLTAFMDEKTSTFTDSVVVSGPNIKIDGNFTDWDYVDYIHVNEEGTGGTLKAIKGYVDAANVNFYLEGTEEMAFAVMNIYIDADNNPATGFQAWQHPAGSGAEFYLEGNLDSERPQDSPGSIYDHTGAGGGWGWTPKVSFADGAKFSKIRTDKGVNMFEFSISRSVLGDISGAVAVAIFESNAGWAVVGQIPLAEQPNSAYIKLEF